MEGIQKARKHKPAAIILDVLMPKSGGIQMYREVKTDENLKNIPVIMISAIAKKTFFHSMQMLNSYRGQTVPEPEAFIEKPPETEELIRLVFLCRSLQDKVTLQLPPFFLVTDIYLNHSIPFMKREYQLQNQ